MARLHLCVCGADGYAATYRFGVFLLCCSTRAIVQSFLVSSVFAVAFPGCCCGWKCERRENWIPAEQMGNQKKVQPGLVWRLFPILVVGCLTQRSKYMCSCWFTLPPFYVNYEEQICLKNAYDS